MTTLSVFTKLLVNLNQMLLSTPPPSEISKAPSQVSHHLSSTCLQRLMYKTVCLWISLLSYRVLLSHILHSHQRIDRHCKWSLTSEDDEEDDEDELLNIDDDSKDIGDDDDSKDIRDDDDDDDVDESMELVVIILVKICHKASR
ncbi:hypothetical protein L6452_02386 [Arctium lappa]|uniref:Uncharacterized protein n=1 Tax=Arctium lappa TaxID=4217 RepID=A0ACB9FJ80_ARCLA|nr:hypothetical protein L6452_02386 [Arctium lappa]